MNRKQRLDAFVQELLADDLPHNTRGTNTMTRIAATAHADSAATTETITATVRDDGALLWRCEERGPRGGRKVLWAPRTATQSKPNEFAIWSHRARDVDPLDIVIQGVR